jgi:hypothetical protein
MMCDLKFLGMHLPGPCCLEIEISLSCAHIFNITICDWFMWLVCSNPS